ncbi:hypothetical protein VF21_05281 [Pseudogymnoascus sp. 05NY08]|nr:hypothetical protein VF21_05281 [Pseudogymnoascus sp. 05NY08]
MWREDEKANRIRKVDLKNAKLKVKGQANATTKRCKWRAAYKSTLRLMKKVNSNLDFINNLPLAIDVETRTYYKKTPPHLYFTKAQLAVWRNFASWSFNGD